jgi:hypothetical protein
VLAAIGFSDQSRFMANEIDDEWANWLLTAKFCAIQLPRLQQLPKRSLGVGEIAS